MQDRSVIRTRKQMGHSTASAYKSVGADLPSSRPNEKKGLLEGFSSTAIAITFIKGSQFPCRDEFTYDFFVIVRSHIGIKTQGGHTPTIDHLVFFGSHRSHRYVCLSIYQRKNKKERVQMDGMDKKNEGKRREACCPLSGDHFWTIKVPDRSVNYQVTWEMMPRFEHSGGFLTRSIYLVRQSFPSFLFLLFLSHFFFQGKRQKNEMKLWFCTKSWLLALVMTFFLGNLVFWSYHPRPSCEQMGTCQSVSTFLFLISSCSSLPHGCAVGAGL